MNIFLQYLEAEDDVDTEDDVDAEDDVDTLVVVGVEWLKFKGFVIILKSVFFFFAALIRKDVSHDRHVYFLCYDNLSNIRRKHK